LRRENLWPWKVEVAASLRRDREAARPPQKRGSAHDGARGIRVLVLPAMLVTLGLYAALHSPVYSLLARVLGRGARTCYFVCPGSLAVNRLAYSWSGVILIVVALLAAWVVADWFDGAPYERPLAFGLSALGFVAAPAAAIGGVGEWLNVPMLQPPVGPLLAAIPAAVVTGMAVQTGWHPALARLRVHRPPELVLLVGALGTGLLLASAAVSLTHPPTGYDALSYHAPLAVFLWHDGNLGTFLDRMPTYFPLAHPGTAELWFGLLLAIGGERLADLGQLPFTVLGVTAIYAFARRLRLRHGAALLSAFAFLLVPMVVMQTGTQVNDLVGTVLLMASVALGSAPTETWSRRRLALLGLGLGLTIATKLVLLPYVAAGGLFLFGVVLREAYARGYPRVQAGWLVIATVMFLLVVAPWWVRDMIRYGNPLYPESLPLLGRGIFISDHGHVDPHFVPNALAWPLYPLLEVHDDRSGFGTLFIVGAIPGLLVAAWRCRRQPVVLFGLLVTLMLPAWFVLTSQPRFLLPIVGLSFGFLPWSLLAMSRRHRTIGAIVLAAAATFSTLVTLNQAIAPSALAPITRNKFYDQIWGIDPVVMSLPYSTGLLLNTGYASTSYPAYYPLLGGTHMRNMVLTDVLGLQPSTL
jgi:hypothetical protein